MLGYWVKSVICWGKTHSMPEPQTSRVSRATEHIIHLTVQRTPTLHKEFYLNEPSELGGKEDWETNKLSDSWLLSPFGWTWRSWCAVPREPSGALHRHIIRKRRPCA